MSSKLIEQKMDEDGAGDGHLHIAMLPWLALGHILPFLELAKRLAGKGHRISFLSTPQNIRRFLNTIPPNISPLIDLVSLPLPPVSGLPESAEATVDLPSQHLRPYLRTAYDALEPQVSTFLKKSSSPPVDWIVHDYACYWVPRVAAECGGIPCAYLGLFSAAVLAFYGPPASLMGVDGSRTEPEQLTSPPAWVPFPSSIAYRIHEARELFRPGLIPDSSGVSEAYRFGVAIGSCELVLVRSCRELESDWLDLLGELYKKPIVPVGLLPPLNSSSSPVQNRGDDDDDDEKWRSTFEWLDKQKPGSVVYAAFGSEVKLNREQAKEIGYGLKSSELPFVWAMREPDLLPEGFEDGSHAGVVCRGWVPQVRILAHPAIGGFLTHGGWNSVVEGLAAGVIMAVLPLMFDQGLNSRDLVARGLAVEVERDESDGSFSGDRITKALRLVMVEEARKPLKVRVTEARELFEKQKMQDEYLNGLLKHLREHGRGHHSVVSPMGI